METINKYNRRWLVLADYTLCDEDWFVMETESGELFMNSLLGNGGRYQPSRLN